MGFRGKEKQQLVAQTCRFVDGGGQRVSIGSSANRSTQLTVGETYKVSAKVDCWVVSGGSAVARDAVPLRDDLGPEHPLYGKRALRNVPAGSSDIVVTDSGDITADLSAVGVEVIR